VEPWSDPPARVDLGGPDLVARLARWASAAAVDEAAGARARERWLRRAADEGATFAGVLLDLAERGSPVIVAGRAGRRHRGVIRAVGVDFCGLRGRDRGDVLLSFAGIAAVRPEARSVPAPGDRPVDVDVGLGEALAAVAEERPRVLVVTMADADGLAGELRSVGRDVLVLRLDGPTRPTAYVPLASVAEVRLA
jgi:hypothetical protein